MKFKRLFDGAFKHVNTLIFLWGFAFDIFILPDIKSIEAKWIGLFYILMVALFIYFREWVVSRNRADVWEAKLFSASSFIISFFSGSALSFVFVYSMRSAELTSSWPILFNFGSLSKIEATLFFKTNLFEQLFSKFNFHYLGIFRFFVKIILLFLLISHLN